jgi:hypothetical protein
MLEITRRYLAAYGPATREDYGRWWAMEPPRAQAQIKALGEEVSQVEVERTRAWMLTRHMREAAEASPPGSVRLLPAFDQYVIGASRVSSNYFPGPFKDRVYRAQGWVSPVLLVDGRMDGIWRYERKGSRLAVEIEPFVELPGWARRAAEAEAERLARLHGRSPQADLAILALGTPMSHRGRACQGPYSTQGKARSVPNPARRLDTRRPIKAIGQGVRSPA